MSLTHSHCVSVAVHFIETTATFYQCLSAFIREDFVLVRV